MDFLFDIGRVLLDFDFESSMRRLLKNETDDSYNRLMQSIESREAFESGQMEASSFIKQSIEASGLEINPEDFRTAWREVFTRNPPMWDVVKRLKAAGGHRLILFSNTNTIHCPWIFSAFPEFDFFDGKVLSYEVGAMKPAPAIYEHAIREFALDPGQTRYIDDLPENIAAGIEFGFRSHLYDLHNHAAFEAWLTNELHTE